MGILGKYERMVYEIKKRENKEKSIVFGILLADNRQSNNKKYILNFMNRFDKLSGKAINFYLPGYIENEYRVKRHESEDIDIIGKTYRFNFKYYDEYIEKLQKDFYIDYPYTPILMLIEYGRGDFSNSTRWIYSLDNKNHDIKTTGIVFENIFNIAKELKDDINLADIVNRLKKSKIKAEIPDIIVGVIGNDKLKALQLLKGVSTNYKLE